MFLKDHLLDTYQKASLDKNNLILENVINRWVHRFGIETMNELVGEDQINLIEEDQEKENQDQINLESLENVQYQKEIDFKFTEEKITENTKIINKDIYKSYKNKYKSVDKEELPLPNINNLRKWIKNDKKAS